MQGTICIKPKMHVSRFRKFTFMNPSSSILTGISFPNASEGWICGYDATILHSSNGGTVGLPETQTIQNSTMLRCAPNPFRDETKISFDLPQRMFVRLTVLNNLGQEILCLMNGTIDGGAHSVKLSGQGLTPGFYFCRLIANGFSTTRKLLIIR
jgi:hypothetical protein